MRILIAGLALSFALAASGHAQLQRLLPANGKLGELSGRQHPYPLVQINKEALRLAPGALIYDQNNRTILHGYLPDYAVVLYVPDFRGEVSHIIILTPEELARVEQAQAGQR